MEKAPTIIIDNGSGFCKAGFAEDDFPRSVFPPFVSCQSKCGGKTKIVGSEYKDQYVGDEAPVCKNVFCNKPKPYVPIQRGIITDWNSMDKVWHHIFYNELRVVSDHHPVLITESPNTPKAVSEKMTEVMFEKFSIPLFYKACPSLLSLYASGRIAGAILDIGNSQSHCVSVLEGNVLPQSIKCSEIAGKDLSHFLIAKLLRNYPLPFRSKFRIAEDIKAMHCIVSSKSSISLKPHSLLYTTTSSAGEAVNCNTHNDGNSMNYTLPDGEIIKLFPDTYTCPNVFFNPQLFQMPVDGVHAILRNSISSVDCDAQRVLVSNIVLSGGSTLFPGFADRLENELCNFFTSENSSSSSFNNNTINVFSPDDRKYSAWIGGSVLASQIQTNTNLWASKLEYNEFGPEIINKKFSNLVFTG